MTSNIADEKNNAAEHVDSSQKNLKVTNTKESELHNFVKY